MTNKLNAAEIAILHAIVDIAYGKDSAPVKQAAKKIKKVKRK